MRGRTAAAERRATSIDALAEIAVALHRRETHQPPLSLKQLDPKERRYWRFNAIPFWARVFARAGWRAPEAPRKRRRSGTA